MLLLDTKTFRKTVPNCEKKALKLRNGVGVMKEILWEEINRKVKEAK